LKEVKIITPLNDLQISAEIWQCHNGFKTLRPPHWFHNGCGNNVLWTEWCAIGISTLACTKKGGGDFHVGGARYWRKSSRNTHR
jgi:hypothetical protein